MLENEAPNMISKAYLVELVNAGYRAEVVCQADAFVKSSVWYGEWYIRVVSPDGLATKYLTATTQPGPEDEIEFRVFKTANGLISFMVWAGFTYTTVPFVAGGVSSHSKEAG